MPAAVLFLPMIIILFMKRASVLLLYLGSGAISCFSTLALLGIAAPSGLLPGLGLGPFGAVLAASLLAVLTAAGVQGAADDMVADSRQVFDPPSTDEHHGVLLEVVAFARD